MQTKGQVDSNSLDISTLMTACHMDGKEATMDLPHDGPIIATKGMLLSNDNLANMLEFIMSLNFAMTCHS